MKTIGFKNILFGSALIMVVSCQKLTVDAPNDFAVTANNVTIKAGDTAVFTLTGTADFISFFSGEIGSNYAFRNRTQAAGNVRLVFQTNMTQGLLTNPDSLFLLISTNLRGYDSASVVNANWQNITTRNTRWPASLTTNFTTSDSIDLSDFNTADSVNIAFRVVNRKYATQAQRRRQIQNVTLINFAPNTNGVQIFSNFNSVGWVQANIKNNPAPTNNIANNFHAWNVGEAGVNALNSTLIISNRACNSNGIPIQTAYPITFDPSTAVNTDENDDWLITSAVNLKTVRPDVGIAIKRPTDVTLKTYRYRFLRPGTYMATFVALNERVNSREEVVKQLQITVTP